MKFRPKALGIRTQIFCGFALFTVIIVALLWVFQVTLLNTFYKAIKKNEIRQTASYIAENLESDDLTGLLQGIVGNTAIDVMITDDRGYLLTNITSISATLFTELSTSKCARIYAETKVNGGEYMGSYTQWRENNGLAAFDGRGSDYGRRQNAPEGIVFVKTVTTGGGHPRLLILNTLVTPVDSTVDTLKVQLWCLTGIMVVLSGVLALVLSRRIARPITGITAGAKILAEGNYSVNFEVAGCMETRELSETLNYAAGELSKVEGLRRELIANVSHDLRTPLTMITGYAEVMRDIPGENTPENVQTIIDEAERLKNLVNDLLDISRLEAGKLELNLEHVNLTAAIREILSRYDKLADYSFDFYCGGDVFVRGDALKLSQVVYNLVNNAITYTGPDKRVTLTQTVEQGRVRVEITDTGEGIPQDKLKDIWERYYKVDKDHKRSAVGTGLGLSIVRQILDLHGGGYGVVSTLGKGSTFWFELPVGLPDIPKAVKE